MSSNPQERAEAAARVRAFVKARSTQSNRDPEIITTVITMDHDLDMPVERHLYAGDLLELASSAERSEEDLVSAIAESLRDFQVSAGGMLLSLTETERRRIGWTVRGVCQQVVRDGP